VAIGTCVESLVARLKQPASNAAQVLAKITVLDINIHFEKMLALIVM